MKQRIIVNQKNVTMKNCQRDSRKVIEHDKRIGINEIIGQSERINNNLKSRA